ncbi:P-loop containing nucleoside triphosphate hydrolase protein [Entophlyctis helioformis]|nr:P-loop containing nucleoside triphosphate hydrolase protein [Entophlyctis helioformis]
MAAPTTTTTTATAAASLAVEVNALNFDFGGPAILTDVTLHLKRGSRCLLVGANGAGKSTLLRILAGKSLSKGDVKVLGRRAFDEGSQSITYLGTEWALNPVVRRDVPVSRLLKTLGAERNRERCAELLEIMDVNPHWHMHQISDGQRRRVQIVLGLMEPWDVLLLDEVTVDLDVLVRTDLLNFLKRETEQRGASIVYATHIFDGLGGWPTHVAHMFDGKIEVVRDLAVGFPELEEAMRDCRTKLLASTAGVSDSPSTAYEANRLLMALFNSPLLLVVERWLREDYRRLGQQGQLDKEGKAMSKWDILSDNMKEYGDRYYNYWN